ncbi:conserved hypothetical membrane protein [Candidatus Koribacter versatilis Ellin345]|uniref:Conserved hypothetical membrane protein n=1 Tax=Koribacter versatilis (strain Ellin345) TaxID=204669 RepID=Q1IPV5_KORVE|nr:PH domain-containing protein [Candidatus Koribacter versatilis]ABF41095.1 conserved hypothetical membrane protein [Candidatus Koribacter versatilis Ellin345]
MAYIDKNLVPGEQVVYKTRLHWIVIFWSLLFSLGLGIAGIWLLAGTPGLAAASAATAPSAYRIGGGALVVVALVLFLIALIRRNSVEMAVTNRRVTVKVGLLSRRTQEMLLGRIESIGVDQTVAGRMLNYGTVTIRGTGGTADPFHNIYHPLEFRHYVQDQLERRVGPDALQPPPRTV